MQGLERPDPRRFLLMGFKELVEHAERVLESGNQEELLRLIALLLLRLVHEARVLQEWLIKIAEEAAVEVA